MMGWAGCVSARWKPQSCRWFRLLLQNRRRVSRPPSDVVPDGSSGIGILAFFRDLRYVIWNSVPSRIIACMMMARRLASATLAFLIVERAPIASAHVFSLRGPAHLVNITLAAS